MRGWSVRRAAIAILTVLLLAASCSRQETSFRERVFFRKASGGTVATGMLPVADTESGREQGLMGVKSLGADQGMLFVFDGSTRSAFWMKGTLIPLSVAFWGSDGRIVDILDMLPCRSDPCRTYTPRADYTVALEMNLGWFRDNGVEIGDRAVWVTVSP